ncbi:MAG: hypothetical protein J6S96_01990 [Muribaculaceae bacterium]|nr:hypothetical protein [Muribaculaceae bacterium]
MKRTLMLSLASLVISMFALAQDFKTFENEAFSIGYPSDWAVTWYGDTYVNIVNDDGDGDIRFDVTFNDEGPMKSQLQACVDNWVYMKESGGHKVDQKMVKEDYALVRSIETDEDDGTQSVEVWFLMISLEPECFTGSMKCPFEKANEALDILVNMIATLSPR